MQHNEGLGNQFTSTQNEAQARFTFNSDYKFHIQFDEMICCLNSSSVSVLAFR